MLILLLDDDDTSNYVIRRILLNIEKVEVDSCKSVNEALSYLEKTCPDAIFLDINMPEVNGFEFLDILAKKNLCPSADIIIVTSSLLDSDKQKAMKYGSIKDYIVKPLTQKKAEDIVSKISVK